MGFCGACGTDVGTAAQFCSACGAPVHAEVPSAAIVAPVAPAEQHRPRRRWLRRVLIGGGVVAALLIVLGVIGAFTTKDSAFKAHLTYTLQVTSNDGTPETFPPGTTVTVACRYVISEPEGQFFVVIAPGGVEYFPVPAFYLDNVPTDSALGRGNSTCHRFFGKHHLTPPPIIGRTTPAS